MKFEMKPVRFTEDPLTKTGGLAEITAGKPDALAIYLVNDNGLSTHITDMIPDLRDLALWIVETLNQGEPENTLRDHNVRICCGFMDAVDFEHMDGMHSDVFECGTCGGHEAGAWVTCDCTPDGPEYNSDDDIKKLDDGSIYNSFML